MRFAQVGFSRLKTALNRQWWGLAMVTALWESEDAYCGWVEDSCRAGNAADGAEVLEAMELEVGGGSLYEIVISATPGAELLV